MNGELLARHGLEPADEKEGTGRHRAIRVTGVLDEMMTVGEWFVA